MLGEMFAGHGPEIYARNLRMSRILNVPLTHRVAPRRARPQEGRSESPKRTVVRMLRVCATENAANKRFQQPGYGGHRTVPSVCRQRPTPTSQSRTIRLNGSPNNHMMT
jgi:hypothetical protein